MTVYCLTGLGADSSVFELLKINHPKVCIEWIPSFKWESMEEYAKRLCAQVDESEPFALLGVSFGGMLAVEMNKFIQPERTILVTSVARRSELPFWIKLVAKTRLNRMLPVFLFDSNPRWLIWYFGIKADWVKKMVYDIAKKADPAFTKLCIDKVLSWKNEWLPNHLVRIHASNDLLLPAPPNTKGIEINKAGHFAIIENANEISGIVDEILSKVN